MHVRFAVPKTVSATEARIHLGELLRDVAEKGDTIIVERSGKPQAVILSIEAYERLHAGQLKPGEDWWERAQRVSERIAKERGDRPWPSIVEVINASRQERGGDILAAVVAHRKHPRRASDS
jgi:prevent-host-death family protein